MDTTRERPCIFWFSVGLVVVGVCALALGQQAPAEKPNELVVGKLIYVASMPMVSTSGSSTSCGAGENTKLPGSEGVDLVIQATNPEKELRLKFGGDRPAARCRPAAVAYPEGKTRRNPRNLDQPVDWVTNQPVWHATS